MQLGSNGTLTRPVVRASADVFDDDLTCRYEALGVCYGMTPTHNNTGVEHK